jgi:hypothetical protein
MPRSTWWQLGGVLTLLVGAVAGAAIGHAATASSFAAATYLGGTFIDLPPLAGIGRDGAGNVYVVGRTWSSDFPTVPPVSVQPSSVTMAFVSTLDPTLSTLLRSVILPPGLWTGTTAIAVDATGNVYLTGVTGGDLPLANAAQPVYGGNGDAFVAKLDTTGALAFSTYLGGDASDYGSSIAVDGSGRVHVVGISSVYRSEGTVRSFPTHNAFQADYADGEDFFVAQLDATGAIEYATLLGGSQPEGFRVSLAVNESGDTWIAGQTSSADFPVTPGAWRTMPGPPPPAQSGEFEGFVTRLDLAGAPVFSTYAPLTAAALDVDADDDVVLPTLSLDGTGQPRPFMAPSAITHVSVKTLKVDAAGRVHVSGSPGFAAEFDPAHPDEALCTRVPNFILPNPPPQPGPPPWINWDTVMTVTANGDTVVGSVTSYGGFATPGAYQPFLRGRANAFIARITSGSGIPFEECFRGATTTTTTSSTSSTTSLPGGEGCGDGLAGARCHLGRLLAFTPCGNDTVAPRLARFVTRKVTRVTALLDRSTSLDGDAHRRAIHRSARQLAAIEKRMRKATRSHVVSDACGQGLGENARAARDTIVGL